MNVLIRPRRIGIGLLVGLAGIASLARPVPDQAPQPDRAWVGQARIPAVDKRALPSLRQQASLSVNWLRERLGRFLPAVMRREGIDMWIVVCREHAEDPVYPTLVPLPNMFAWRLTMIVFFDRRPTGGVECIMVNP